MIKRSIFLAMIFLSSTTLADRYVLGADASEAVAWNITPQAVGALPAGWKSVENQWVVKNDESAEVFKPSVGLDWTGVTADQLGRAPVLVTVDNKSGVIDTAGKTLSDFDVAFRTKHFLDRNYWYNQFRFRIQPDRKHYYCLYRERFGKITLAVRGPEDKDPVVLQSSNRAFEQQEGQWLWMRLVAKANHFQVFVSADGISWIQAIDTTDPKSTFNDGMAGFTMSPTTRIILGLEPLAQDETRKKAGAWLETLSQSRAFLAQSLDRTQYKFESEIYVLDADRAPTQLKISGGTEPINVPLSGLTAGLNRIEAWVPLASDGKSAQLEVSLLRGDERIDTAPAHLIDVLGKALLKASNPEPEKAGQWGDRPINREAYMETLDKIYAKYGNTGRMSWDSRWADAATLYLATHEQKYLDRDLEWVRRWLAERASGKAEFPAQHFMSRYGFAMACDVAMKSGKLSPEEQIAMKSMLGDFMAHCWTEGGGVINRATGYVLAYPILLRLLPDYPLRKELTSYIDRFKEDLSAHPEPLENSTNYMGITLMFLVHWIDDNNPELWKDPRVKEGFENVLQVLTPSGDIPQYGDYGGGQRHSFMLVYVFERLAAVYKDGRYKWAARTVARRCLDDFNFTDVSGSESQALAYAYAATDDSIAPVIPDSGGAVLKRTDGHLDKLVLRSGWGTDDRYALFDLLNGCEHGDNGALSLVSVSHGHRQSLFDKAGRDLGFHSLPLVRDESIQIPYRDRPFDPGQWCYACIDLPLNWSFEKFSGGIGSPMLHQWAYGPGMLPYDFTYLPTQQFAFAMNFIGSGHATVWLDDLKLIKRGPTPDQPADTLVLEDFEGPPKHWIGDGGRAEGGHLSKHAGRFDINFDEGGWIGRKFPMPLDINSGKWDQLEFWYKLESDDARTAPGSLCIGDHLGYPHDYLWHHVPSFPTSLTSFRDTPLATFASLRLDERDIHGQRQTKDRQVVFIKRSGVLWIRDVINRQGDRPWAAGPVWQIGQLAPARGPNWVDTWFNDNLLVWCLPRAGRVNSLLLQPFNGRYGHGSQADYPMSFQQTAQGVGPVKDMIFDSVLVPHDASVDPKAIAEGIKVVRDDGGVTVLEVAGDLLVANRTGGETTAGDITTDCAFAYVRRKDGRPTAATGDKGTKVICSGTSFVIDGQATTKP